MSQRASDGRRPFGCCRDGTRGGGARARGAAKTAARATQRPCATKTVAASRGGARRRVGNGAEGSNRRAREGMGGAPPKQLLSRLSTLPGFPEKSTRSQRTVKRRVKLVVSRGVDQAIGTVNRSVPHHARVTADEELLKTQANGEFLPLCRPEPSARSLRAHARIRRAYAPPSPLFRPRRARFALVLPRRLASPQSPFVQPLTSARVGRQNLEFEQHNMYRHILSAKSSVNLRAWPADAPAERNLPPQSARAEMDEFREVREAARRINDLSLKKRGPTFSGRRRRSPRTSPGAQREPPLAAPRIRPGTITRSRSPTCSAACGRARRRAQEKRLRRPRPPRRPPAIRQPPPWGFGSSLSSAAKKGARPPRRSRVSAT